MDFPAEEVRDTGSRASGSRTANGPLSLAIFLRLISEKSTGLKKSNLRKIGRRQFFLRIVEGAHRPENVRRSTEKPYFADQHILEDPLRPALSTHDELLPFATGIQARQLALPTSHAIGRYRSRYSRKADRNPLSGCRFAPYRIFPIPLLDHVITEHRRQAYAGDHYRGQQQGQNPEKNRDQRSSWCGPMGMVCAGRNNHRAQKR